MYRKLLSIICLLAISTTAVVQAQTQSPSEFLGYELGERFTHHHRMVAYVEHVAATNDRVHVEYYGQSYEHRPLLAVFVSSPKHITQLEQIRTDNLRRAGVMEGEPETEVPIIWMSYNVHGNEAVATETALMTLWELIDPANQESKVWLENSLVVIDPCLNPDGHNRYVSWYEQKANRILQPDPQSTEHFEPWPGGRPNHYLYDLNRDWAWQVQKESQERNRLYNKWLPQIHVDFHEQGINAPYFFAPAAEPIHEFVTPFQREFQGIIGRNNAKYFDEQAWLYFTREVFDLFYPSYGDTWPTFNGAIGMTYEQAGSGRAGLGIVTAIGDTLTLYDRIIHHHTAGMSSIEIAQQHGKRLLDEFTNYFHGHAANPVGKYRSYVIKAGNSPARLEALKTLLDRNGIQYGQAASRSGLHGYAYFSAKNESFGVEEGDLVVSAHQPKSVLVQTLFEPNPTLSDSATYDITSWALPYAYGLEAFATETRLDVVVSDAASPANPSTNNQVVPGVLAYAAPWNAAVHGSFLAELLREKIRVRYATKDFVVAEQRYDAGTLIISREGNQQHGDFDRKLVEIADKHGVQLAPVATGYMDSGKDFGSSAVRAIVAPKVALIGGSGVSSLNFGEIWHYFEQELGYPLTIIDLSRLSGADLSHYNVLILPSGSYGSLGERGFQQISSWIAAGGKLIAFDSAVSSLVGKPGFSISPYLNDEEKKAADREREKASVENLLVPYGERTQQRTSSSVSGAVFELQLDDTHPLGFGTAGHYYTLKNSASKYAYLKSGVNVGVIPSDAHYRSGFVGHQVRDRIPGSLVFGVENRGRGSIVYLVDNPMFRGFWESGKLIVNNALFFVGQ